MIGRRPCFRADLLRDASHQRDIDQAVHRIGRRLDEDHRDAADSHGALGRAANAFLVESVA